MERHQHFGCNSRKNTINKLMKLRQIENHQMKQSAKLRGNGLRGGHAPLWIMKWRLVTWPESSVLRISVKIRFSLLAMTLDSAARQLSERGSVEQNWTLRNRILYWNLGKPPWSLHLRSFNFRHICLVNWGPLVNSPQKVFLLSLATKLIQDSVEGFSSDWTM